jgi:hypothetical protein
MKLFKIPHIIKKAYSETDREISKYPFSFFFGFLIHTFFFILDRCGFDVSISINKKHPNFNGPIISNNKTNIILLLQGPPGRLKKDFNVIIDSYLSEFNFSEIIYTGWDDFEPNHNQIRIINNGSHKKYINAYEKQRICILSAIKDIPDDALIVKMRADSYLQKRDAAVTLLSFYKLVKLQNKNPIIVIEQQKPIYKNWLSDHLIFTSVGTIKRLFKDSYNLKFETFNSNKLNPSFPPKYTAEVLCGKKLGDDDFIFSIDADCVGYKYLKYASWQSKRWNWASMPELFNASRSGYYAESNIGTSISLNKLLNCNYIYNYEKYDRVPLDVYKKDITG